MSTPPGPVTYHLLRSLLSFRMHSSPLCTIFCKASNPGLDFIHEYTLLSFFSKIETEMKMCKLFERFILLVFPQLKIVFTQPNNIDALHNTCEPPRCV